MKLVDGAKTAWKWFSVQLAVAGAALQGAVLAFPSLKDWLSDTAMHWVGLAILFAIVGGRLIDQGKPDA